MMKIDWEKKKKMKNGFIEILMWKEKKKNKFLYILYYIIVLY